MATLTYVYADQTAVLVPLAPEHVPGGYDLCARHCETLSPPRGWTVVRRVHLPAAPVPDEAPAAAPGDDPVDDLLALADAVREVGLRPDELPVAEAGQGHTADVVVLAERRHLKALGDPSAGA